MNNYLVTQQTKCCFNISETSAHIAYTTRSSLISDPWWALNGEQNFLSDSLLPDVPQICMVTSRVTGSGLKGVLCLDVW